MLRPRKLTFGRWNITGKCTKNQLKCHRNFGRKSRHSFTGKRRMTLKTFTRTTSTWPVDLCKLNGWKELPRTWATTCWIRTCAMEWATRSHFIGQCDSLRTMNTYLFIMINRDSQTIPVTLVYIYYYINQVWHWINTYQCYVCSEGEWFFYRRFLKKLFQGLTNTSKVSVHTHLYILNYTNIGRLNLLTLSVQIII